MEENNEIAITIKPTMSCNMRCRHCFKADLRKQRESLPLSTAVRFLELAADFSRDVKVTLHGGEPSLMGAAYYRELFRNEQRIAAEKGVVFANRFTTNALLLKGELLDVLLANDARLKISFDGPFNDDLREKTEIVKKNISEARVRGAKIIILCTLARNASNHLMELYKWFNEWGLDIKLLPIEPRGFALFNNNLLLQEDEFANALKNAYNYWLHDTKCQISCTTFEDFAMIRSTQQYKPFWFRREIALNPDGHIHPFGRPNDIRYDLGRPEDINSLEDCFQSDVYKNLMNFLKGKRAVYCEACPACGSCNGVCLFMGYMYTDSEALLQRSCRISRKIFDIALESNDIAYNDWLSGKQKSLNPRAIQALLYDR